MSVIAAQHLLEQICSSEGLQTHLEGADAISHIHMSDHCLLYHGPALGSSLSL